MPSPQAPTRAELSAFIKDQRTLRAFERLFEAVPGDALALQAIIEEVAAGAQLTADTARGAKSDTARLADALESLSAALLTARKTSTSALERRVADLEAFVLTQR